MSSTLVDIKDSRTQVTPRDWKLVQETFKTSTPFNYVVMDDFLDISCCENLRQQLLNHWGWRYKNWISKNLHNKRPNIPEIFLIAKELKANCYELFQEYNLINYWSLMYHRNISGGIHADNAALTLTLWLTPDEYNLDKNTGGLVLYDVKRSPEMLPHEHLSYTNSSKFVEENTKGENVVIKYKYNRAVLFDAWTFHKTDILDFSCQGIDSYRINISFAFNNPAIDIERMNCYFESAKN